MSPPIYAVLAALEAEELNRLCNQDNEPVHQAAPTGRAVSNLDHIGCGIGRIETTGQSAGSTAEQHAARALALEAAALMSPRKQRRMY